MKATEYEVINTPGATFFIVVEELYSQLMDILKQCGIDKYLKEVDEDE